ncbi:MAG: phosphoglycerate kinase [Candidatus Parcubacteria bacterium]|nr:MAG: phosphoglycerate kinase [Candidatus Parcubacteria bacterium]
MIKFKKTQLLRFNLKKVQSKNILIRVDFNVPVQKGKILEKFRIESIKNSLNLLKSAKRIVFISHFGDPERPNINYSFKKLLPQIEKILKVKINFIKDLDSPAKEKYNLLENLRFWPGEKNCDPEFANKIANYGELFINEAFSASHRQHASINLLPKILPTFYGPNFEKEVNLLNKILTAKKLVMILGGAKISTKLPLIKKFLIKTRVIILAGGLANTYLKAQGFEIGKSLTENYLIEDLKKIKSKKIFIPPQFINQNLEKKLLTEIKKNDIIYDVSEESSKIIFNLIKKDKVIIWNGPLGFIENKNFTKGTLALANYLSNLTNSFVLIGGGDTLAFLEKHNLLKKFNHISLGGGAMLSYLADPEKFKKNIGIKF